MNTISVIIVNLNGEKYLRDCLESLASQTFRDFEVIMVDNGSTDNSLDLVRKDFPWVRVTGLAHNTGFAKGNNTGFAVASCKYMVTLNNDTIADSNWLQALFGAAEADPSVGMVASKIFLGREGSELDSAGMLIYPDGMSRQRGRGETDCGQFDDIREVLFPSACAALYRSEMLKNIGWFDEHFFSYCEDADLGLRARLAGWKA
ncbi:MAG: glycosyltransferase family 2 protein, partial [Nitrospirae bacterium]|nr:glycosyltransferase family 2 protein [Nitrospirota bacterium]